MPKDDRKCQCGEPADNHEAKNTTTSSWRGKCLTAGSTCKRYKWARPAKAAEKPADEPQKAEAPAA